MARLLLFQLLAFSLSPHLDAENVDLGKLTQLYVPDTTYVLEVASSQSSQPRTETIPTVTTESAEQAAFPAFPTKNNSHQAYELKAVREGNQTVVEVRLLSIKSEIYQKDQLVQAYDSSDPAKSIPFLQQLYGSIKEKKFSLVYDDHHQFIKTITPEHDVQTPIGDQRAFSTKQLAEAFRLMRDGFLPAVAREKNQDGSWQVEHTVELPPLGKFHFQGKAIPDKELNSEQLLPITIEGLLEHKLDSPSEATTTTLTFSDAKISGKLWFDPALHQTKTMESITTMLIHVPEQPVIEFQHQQTITLRSISTTPPTSQSDSTDNP